MRSRAVIGLMAAVLLIAACTSLECPVNNTVRCSYSLQKPNGTVDTMGVDTLWVWSPRADKTDTLLVNRLCGSKATTFSLPVSHTQPVDLIALLLCDTIGTEWEDTIWVGKDNFPHFEGVDCQASYFHRLTSVRSTHRIIDTVLINNPEINYDTSNPHLLLRLKARR